jgi:hypothetical protein
MIQTIKTDQMMARVAQEMTVGSHLQGIHLRSSITIPTFPVNPEMPVVAAVAVVVVMGVAGPAAAAARMDRALPAAPVVAQFLNRPRSSSLVAALQP